MSDSIRPTPSMIAAVRKVPAPRRRAAAKLAEEVFFQHLRSPVAADARNTQELHDWAGEAAAAEVAYRFA